MQLTAQIDLHAFFFSQSDADHLRCFGEYYLFIFRDLSTNKLLEDEHKGSINSQ